MDGEIDGTDTYIVRGFSPESTHGKMQFFRDAVDKVAQKMVPVNGTDAYTHRVETVGIFLEVHGHDRIPVLGGKAYGCLAVPLVHFHRVVLPLEAYDFIARKRMTVRTADELGPALTGQIIAYEPAGLVGRHMSQPVRLRFRILVGAYLDAIASLEHGLDGRKLAVDSGIMGMFSYTAVYLESEIEGGSTFREYDAAPFRGKHHNVVIVEG